MVDEDKNIYSLKIPLQWINLENTTQPKDQS